MSYEDSRRYQDSSERKRTPYLVFLKAKREELLSTDPSLSKKQVMSAVVAAWKELSPAEKRGYKIEEEQVSPPAVRSRSGDRTPLPRKRPLYEQPEREPPNPLLVLGRALKALVNYFLVRPI